MTQQPNFEPLPASDLLGFIVVARLRLPISIRNLKLSVDAFIKMHGRGLLLHDNGDGWLEIRKPNATAQTPPDSGTKNL